MTTPEAFCANPRHTLTTITEGDYIRCGDCGGRLRDDDPRLARVTNPSQQQHKPPMVAGDHIVRAKAELAAGEYRPAMAHALVAIAEVLLVSTTAAAVDDAVKHAMAALASALKIDPGADQ